MITTDVIRTLSDDFSEEKSYSLTTEFPLICKHVPADCEPLLLPFDSIHNELLVPAVDLKHLKLVNTTIKISLKQFLRIKECFRYFPTGKGSNEIYALCLKNHSYEWTILVYKLKYTSDFAGIKIYRLGDSYGSHIDMDSQLIVIHSNYTVRSIHTLEY